MFRRKKLEKTEQPLLPGIQELLDAANEHLERAKELREKVVEIGVFTVPVPDEPDDDKTVIEPSLIELRSRERNLKQLKKKIHHELQSLRLSYNTAIGDIAASDWSRDSKTDIRRSATNLYERVKVLYTGISVEIDGILTEIADVRDELNALR